MKILFISEALSRPFDEGIKNVAFSLYKQLGEMAEAVSVTNAGNETDGLEIRKIRLNKLFISAELKNTIKDYSPEIILYLPEASITFNSFIRARVLKLISSHAKIVVLGVKHIEYSCLQRQIIANLLKPDYLLLLGRFEMELFHGAGMKVKVLPPAVDSDKFCKATDEEKRASCLEFGIPADKTVVLHVGHIRSTRNVECLLDVQRIDGVQVVIVGSTSTAVESDLKDALESEGIIVINKAITDVSKVYKMADVYVFPVVNKIACIDMPLSVLEAMACNLPVITTRFGGLEEYFKEDAGFRYFNTVEELISSVKMIMNMDVEEINNSRKVMPFTWNKFTDQILTACEKLA